jgi:hypothetical protein
MLVKVDNFLVQPVGLETVRPDQAGERGTQTYQTPMLGDAE